MSRVGEALYAAGARLDRNNSGISRATAPRSNNEANNRNVQLSASSAAPRDTCPSDQIGAETEDTLLGCSSRPLFSLLTSVVSKLWDSNRGELCAVSRVGDASTRRARASPNSPIPVLPPRHDARALAAHTQRIDASRPAEHLAPVNYGQLITIDPAKRSGKPCIRNLRITVTDVLEYLAGGMSIPEILADFPELTDADVRACLAFAADRERKLAVIGS